MGIFSKLFGPSSDIKKELEDIYVPMFQAEMSMSPSQAKSTFRDLYKQVKEEAKADGSINLPLNLGDTLLEKEAIDKKINPYVARRRNEGVRDCDIRWWLNMHELERRMMKQVDDMYRLALFIKLREEDSFSEDEARKRMKKVFPIFGDPNDTSTSTGDDRPLHFELKERINIYIEKRSQADTEGFKNEIEESSSFNALIRNEIKKGNV